MLALLLVEILQQCFSRHLIDSSSFRNSSSCFWSTSMALRVVLPHDSVPMQRTPATVCSKHLTSNPYSHETRHAKLLSMLPSLNKRSRRSPCGNCPCVAGNSEVADLVSGILLFLDFPLEFTWTCRARSRLTPVHPSSLEVLPQTDSRHVGYAIIPKTMEANAAPL